MKTGVFGQSEARRKHLLPPGFSYVLLFQERGPVLLRYLRRRTAPQPGTLRWAPFLPDEKWGKESLRAFPPKDLPWGTRLPLRWFSGRPVTPAVAPVTATTPGYPGNWPYRQAVSTSGPTWASGVPAAGSLAAHRWEQRFTRVRPWGVEAPSGREVGAVYRASKPSM